MPVMDKIKGLISPASSGKSSSREYEQWSAPAPWRNEDGVYIGDNGQAWLYKKLDLNPVKWEDNEARLGIAKQLENLLNDVGQLSKDPVGGIRAFSNNREIHLSSITWQEVLTPPEGNSPALSDFQSDAYGMTVPRRALFLGVRLVASALSKKEGKSIYKSMEELIRQAMNDNVPQINLYQEDIQHLSRIFSQHEAKTPTRNEFNQLESWFNQGMGSDVLVEEMTDRLIVADGQPIQFAAARTFEAPRMQSPDDQWLMDALSHPGDAPHMISVRCELEPPKSTRQRARSSQRRIQANIEEEEKSGDLEKVESSESFKLAKDFENYLSGEKRPVLSRVSILMSRSVSEASETYMDFLDTVYGIQMTTLEHRQILALDETLPTSNIRVNPFLQDVNVPMLANAGLQAFAELGDDKGCFAGFIDPDGSPLFIDPSASSKANLPPAFGVFGDPGSGKSSPVDEFVMTPEGVKPMGELKPGDYTMSPTGDPVRIGTIHPQGHLDTYRVTLEDGRQLETSDTHLWHVINRFDGPGEWRNVELRDIMDQLTVNGQPQWFVPMPRPLHYEDREFNAEPYAIGSAAAGGVEALQYVDKATRDEIQILSRVDDSAAFPKEYMLGSFHQRQSLLQGVMDIAGSVNNDGFLVAESLHPGIALQVQELVWSLGGVATLDASADPLLDVVMEVPVDVNPFRNSPEPDYDKADVYMFMLPIVNIEKLEPKEHLCITVESDNHLYVSGEYVVTHNTFFAQNFSTQCVLYGMPVFFINPKAADALTGLCDYINDSTPASADVVSINSAEEEDGAFDPFRFSNDMSYAAEVAGTHILSALDIPQDPLPRDRRLALQSGLKRGAEKGARCAWDALDYIMDPEHREYFKTVIAQQMDASSLFSLGIAKKPRSRMSMVNDHLTLVNFDREIGLPQKTDPSQYSHSERIALSTVNLVTKAALEILIANKGGVLVLDEAWTFLSQPESLAALNRISREGRSLNIVPVFLTQRIKDVVTRDLEGFMSRVLVLKLNEKAEAEAAFKICGLKPTKERLELLREAGPKPPKDGKPAVWAQGMFRDLKFRHSWVALGPTPEDAMKAWSTNPDDKKKFEEERLRRIQEEQDRAAIVNGTESSGGDIPDNLVNESFNEAGSAASAGSPDEAEPDLPVKPAFAEQKPAWANKTDESEVDQFEEGLPAPKEETEKVSEAEAPAPAFARPTPAWQSHAEKAYEDPEARVRESAPVESAFAKPTPAWSDSSTPYEEEPVGTGPSGWSKPAAKA